MTIRAGLVVFLRMIGIIGLLYAALLLLNLMALDLSAFPAALRLGLPLADIAVMAILVLLIRLAPLIVDFLGPSAAETVPDSGFSIENLQAVGFSVLGVYLVVSSGTGLLGDLALAPPDQWGMVPATFWFKPAIMLAAGLYLTAGAPHLRRLVGAMRRAGQG